MTVLVRRLRKTGISNFDDYCDLLEDQDHEEFTHFSNAITTILTSFFRENHHFEILAETALPEIMARNKATKKIRVWSAGCSTGMEMYSIAMVLKEVVPDNMGWDVKILATDLDTNVLETERYQLISNTVSAILTEMGDDGARGMKEMHEVGSPTIAQDEKSSVVWGMPGEAVKHGGVDHVLSLDHIAEKLLLLCNQ